MEKIVIEKAICYIKEFFSNEYSGHDYWHSEFINWRLGLQKKSTQIS